MKKAPASVTTIHLVFSSHWDREWYLPFQFFRAKLVRILDHVLDELESGRLPFYQMDGQFIPVQDYLEIRPHKASLIRDLVEQGRFVLGPWYTLPDAFLVSGESLVRNLQMGMKRASALGQTSRVGWLCDLFGHNSQMPQILSLLGIDNAFVWRGVPPQLGYRFNWLGADRSTVKAHVFPINGYCDFAGVVREIGMPALSPTVEEMVTKALEYRKIPANRDRKDLLWFDGADHVEFDHRMLEVAKLFNEKSVDCSLVVSTLDRYAESLRKTKESLPQWQGEMREAMGSTTNGWLIPGVGSSRVPLKQANHASETLLTLWAEPWCARSSQLGAAYPHRELELAWEYLLTNHPHDSICGCSTDETHADMPYRFAQCRQLGEVCLQSAFDLQSRTALDGKVKKDEIGFSLFASAGGESQGSPEIYLRLPRTWPQFNEFFGFEPKPAFRIYTANGEREIPYQLLQVTPHSAHPFALYNKMPQCEDRIGIRLALQTSLSPAEEQHFILRAVEGPTRIPMDAAIGVAPNRLRNEALEIVAEADGTVTLTDLRSGRTYPKLLVLEDTADIGDGWFHGIALTDRSFLSTGGTVSVGLTENGPLLARLCIRVEMKIPREFVFEKGQRSNELVPLVVEHRITLKKESPYAEIETTVHNAAKDHRLRLFCPSGFALAKDFVSDSPFDAVERPIALRKDNHLLKELQVEMTPQQNWVAVTQGKAGLALLAPGQYESGVLDQPDRPLVVTLLRSFRKAVFTDGNDGGQIQGEHKFVLGLAPFDTSPQEAVPAARLYRWAQNLAAPIRFHQSSLSITRPFLPEHASTEEPPSWKGDVVLSACFKDEADNHILRLYNPSSVTRTVKLSGSHSWFEINLQGETIQKVAEKTLRIKPRKIVTLRAQAKGSASGAKSRRAS